MLKNRNRLLLGLSIFIVHFTIYGELLSRNANSNNAHFIDSTSVTIEDKADWQLLLEEMAENGLESSQWEERLSELASHPIPLNTASREMLESIPILNVDQVENLSYYLYRYGPIVNLSELLLVDGIDARTMRWLKPFVVIGSLEESPVDYPPMKKALRFGKQEIRISLGKTLQQKMGYTSFSDSALHYLGDSFHAGFRYGFDYKNQLQWGIVMEKDAGEKWWNGSQGGVDYLSLHLVLKDAKRRNTLILGDYKVRFGQGLVCGSAFTLGKNTLGGIPEQTGEILSRHFSSSEINYWSGAALKLTLKPFLMEKKKKFGLDLCTFYSNRLLDSSVENGYFTSVLETGLHRTPSELETQKKLKQWVLGTHLAFRWTNLSVGFSCMGWMYDASALHLNESWQIFNLSGRKGGTVSADFRTVWHGILVFGELALDHNGHEALLTGASFKPNPRMTVSLLGRKYAPDYLAPFSNAFSEGTSTKNEEGLYVSTDFQLAKRLRFSGYVDLFRFPWLGYSINAPSWGQEVAAELNTTVGRNGLVKLLVKSKTKDKNVINSGLPLYPMEQGFKNQIRLQLSQQHGLWSMKTILYANSYRFGKQQSTGYAVAQDLSLEPSGNSFSILLHTVLFNTAMWDNRIYLWEKDLPGAFSMPMLYGQGCRNTLFIRYNLGGFSLLCKLLDSVQPGLDVLGDQSEQVIGNRRTEVRFQVSWKF